MAAPGVIHVDRFDTNVPNNEGSTSTPVFFGLALRGPISTPTLIRSFSEFKRIFDTFQTNSDLAYAVRGFFENGGVECYVVRLVHYSDVSAGTTSAAESTLAVNDSGADLIVTFDASSPGAWGDDISVEIVAAPLASTTLSAAALAGATSIKVTSRQGIAPGSILRLDGSEYVKVLSVETALVSGTPTHTVTLTHDLGTSIDPGDTVVSQEVTVNVYRSGVLVETFTSLSFESELSNYIETVINDADTGSLYIRASVDATNTRLLAGYAGSPTSTYIPAAMTATSLASGSNGGAVVAADIVGSETSAVGLHAIDSLEDVRCLVVVPDSTTAAYASSVVYEAASIAAERTNLQVFTECDPANGPSAALTARSAAGYDTADVWCGFNRIKVNDPLTGGTRFVSALGHIMGRISSVDNAPQSGPWNAAAGLQRGVLVGALGVERALSNQQMSDLNDAGINVIRVINGQVVVWGVRTLASTDTTFRYINTIRAYKYLKQRTNEIMAELVFRNNDLNLALEVKRRLQTELNDVWRVGGLKGDSPAAAYSVLAGEADGVQTAADTNNGIFRGQVGVALQRPAEFLIFEWSENVVQ